MKHVNINHLFNKVVKINVDKHIWLNKLMRYNHSFNDLLLILKICIRLMHVFWMTTLMHRNINPILDKVAWLQIIIFCFWKMTYFFPDSRNASNSAAILQQRAWRLWDEEHSVTLRWPSGKEKNNHERKCNSRVCCDLTENFVVYMTLELKSDMIVKYDHGCEVQVVKMNSETWLLFIPFSFVISTWIQIFLVIFCGWGGMHYGCICKIIRIAWGYKCVNHDMCKIKIKLKKKMPKERL